MKISVIIPSYRPEEYLFDCLEAIRNQSLNQNEFETLVILNGCNEPYFEQIQKYIKVHSSNIRLIQTDEPGVSNARNIGIEAAKGEYITFVDDDDIVSPTYLEDLLVVSSPTCVGCANSYAFVNNVDDHQSNFLTTAYIKCKSQSYSQFAYRQYLSPPYVKLIHRSIIGDSRFPVDMKKSEDSVFCLLISPRIKDMRLASPDAIYYQRLREGSAMRKKESYWSIIKEHLYIEYKYLRVWIKNPFLYNLKFFLSRLAACGKNCLLYLRNQKNY